MKGTIIYAEDGVGFQEYCNKDGKRIECGEPIGIEMTKDDKTELTLLNNVYFSSEAQTWDDRDVHEFNQAQLKLKEVEE